MSGSRAAKLDNYVASGGGSSSQLMVVRRLIAQRILPARQVVKCAPWVIERAQLELPAVRKAIRRVPEGRRSLTNRKPAFLLIPARYSSMSYVSDSSLGLSLRSSKNPLEPDASGQFANCGGLPAARQRSSIRSRRTELSGSRANPGLFEPTSDGRYRPVNRSSTAAHTRLHAARVALRRGAPQLESLLRSRS